ncbi:MAG: hypothetical protein JWQ95_124 [Sphaerisporangium sp.]|nr:hypothetical protein [Sphaerisporangium sp.]
MGSPDGFVRHAPHPMNPMFAAVRMRLGRALPASVAFVVIIVLWLLEAVRRGNDLILPPPQRVLQAAVDAVTSGDLFAAWTASVESLALGLAIAAVVGIALGVLSELVPFASDVISPIIRLAFVVPTIAVLPLIIAWAGIGLEAKIIIVAYSSFFEIAIFTQAGVQEATKAYSELGKSLEASFLNTVRKLVLPGAVPQIMTGVQLGIGQAMVALILGEFFTAVSGPNDGIGAFIRTAGSQFHTSRLFVGVISVGVVSVALLAGIRWLQTRMAPWEIVIGAGDDD